MPFVACRCCFRVVNFGVLDANAANTEAMVRGGGFSDADLVGLKMLAPWMNDDMLQHQHSRKGLQKLIMTFSMVIWMELR